MPANVVSAVYGRNIPAWHREGVVLPELMTSEEVMQHVNPPIIDSVGTYFEFEGEFLPANGFKLAVAKWADKKPVPLGQVSDRWKPIQFDAAFEMFDPVVESVGACYDAAGVLNGGKTFWCLAHIPEAFAMNGDKSERYLLFYTSNDGKGSAIVKTCWIRVVCANTLAVALGDKGHGEVRIMHKGDIDYKLSVAQGLVKRAWETFAAGETTFQKMLETPVTREDKAAFVTSVLGIDVSKDLSTRSKNILAEVAYTLERGRGATEFPEQKGTLWGLFNGITEYVDHTRTVRNGGNGRLASIAFGSGSQVKERAFRTAEKVVNADGSVTEVLVKQSIDNGYEAESFDDLLNTPAKI